MIDVDQIGQIRHAYFEQGRPIKEIVRTLSVSRATVRNVIRGQETTEFRYAARAAQPSPKLGPWITPIKPKGDKVMRMAAQTPVIEAGRVFIPREAPWLQDYLHELMMFPKGKFDDQVDSTAQALAHIGKPSSADMWLEYYRQRALENYDLVPDNLMHHAHA